MIEPHQRLQRMIATGGLIAGITPHIGPASIDLHLLPLVVAKRWSWWQRRVITRERCFEGDAFTFQPRWFYLASSVEYVAMPPTHCGFVFLRSSLARQGLDHHLAGFIDAGFGLQRDEHGSRITFELSTRVPLKLHANERVAQLIVTCLTEATAAPYAGGYRRQQRPVEAYAGWQGRH